MPPAVISIQAAASRSWKWRSLEFVLGAVLTGVMLALVLLLLIVWWTMFSGRPKGEPSRDDEK